jgi:hypothetical protein
VSAFLRIVRLGGPNSGKTEIERMLDIPELLAVPETATVIITRLGLRPPYPTPELRRLFQYAVAHHQMVAEARAEEEARRLNLRGILPDRGLADGGAYVDEGVPEFEAMLRMPLEDQLRRYTHVLWFEGPPDRDRFEATRDSNPARYERDFDESDALTRRTRAIWERHPRFHVVPYTETFEQKVEIARDIIRVFLRE